MVLMFFYTSLIILIPGVIFAFWAQTKVKSTFAKYSRVDSATGMTGRSLARRLLDSNNLNDIPVENIQGQLSDHYDPKKRVVRLSQSTYNDSSVASLGVVAHELGHVIQHKEKYAPLMIRNTFVPVAQFGSSFAWIIFFGGLLLSTPPLLYAGIFLFTAVVIFSLVTLPVEFDASKRGLVMLEKQVMMDKNHVAMAKKVLSAAAMTYLASTLMAVLQLLRMILIARR